MASLLGSRCQKVEQKVIETFSPEQIKRLYAACRREPYIALAVQGPGDV